MSNLNKLLLVLAIATIAGLIYRINSSSGVADINDQQQQKKDSFHQEQVGEEDISLNNTKSTLNTLLAEKKQSEARVDSLENKQEFLLNKIESMERAKQASVGNSDTDYFELKEKYSQLTYEFERFKEQQIEAKENPPIDNSFLGIEDSDLKPIGVTDYEQTNPNAEQDFSSSNSIVDMIVQPAMDMTGLTPTGDKVAPIGTQQYTSDEQYVWVEQSDRSVVVDKDGNEQYVYPTKSVNEHSIINSPDEEFAHTELDQFGQPIKKKKEIPIYTVPQNSTLFGSVGMSAILGRVPISNELSNPFRFKVIIGSENLASNNLFMPHVQSMTVSGYAEGDFTLECARGTIDKVTFTFKDLTVREITGGEGKDSLGYISDAYGIPCISGQYFTNFPEFMLKQGGLTALSAFAGSIAESAVTTTTNVDGVTTSVVNDSVKNAAGEGFQAGTNELTRWYAERQASAFDVVYVPTGEPVVVNIEKALHIDYEPDGRKLVHKENGREYLGW